MIDGSSVAVFDPAKFSLPQRCYISYARFALIPPLVPPRLLLNSRKPQGNRYYLIIPVSRKMELKRYTYFLIRYIR